MAELRAQLLERCRGRCEVCSRMLGESFALHHRQMRSAGGRDCPENTVLAHHDCHNLGSNSIHLRPAAAYQAGLLVHSWDAPALVPVLLGGYWTYLTADGHYSATAPNEESA